MTSYVSAELRRLVRDRADGLCEYCLVHERDAYFDCEVDHVISEKHGGPTADSNLAYACPLCNRAKGSDLGSLTSSSGVLIRFFNPRADRWTDHFRLDGVRIVPKTEIGDVTARILALNDPERIEEREMLKARGRYPSAAAQIQIG